MSPDEVTIPDSLDDTRPFIRNWQFAVIVVLLIVGICGGIWVLKNQSGDRALARNQRDTSERNDCRALVQAARRDVFDQLNLLLDIDRTSHDIYLGDALLARVGVLAQTDPDLASKYATNHDDLTTDKALAARLIPSLPAVDDIVEHGGDMPVLHSDRTVTRQHFDACPSLS